MKQPKPERPSAWAKYSLAVLAVAVAVGSRLMLDPWMGESGIPYITFNAAVAVVAFLCGWGPGITTTVLGGFACVFFIIPPRHTILFNSSAEMVPLALFIGTGLLVSILAGRLRITRQLAQEQGTLATTAAETLQVTLNSIGDAVLATDTAGRVTFLNPAAASLTGWSAKDAAGEPIGRVFKLISEQTRQPGEDLVARVLTEKRVVAMANHTALVARDGREIPIEDSAAPIVDVAGEITGVVVVFHDVTEKRLAQDALRDSEQRLAYHVDNSPLAVIEWGQDMRLTRWAGEAERMFGWKADEVLGKRMEDFRWIYHEDVPQVAEVSAELQDGTTPRRFSANRNYRKDGSIVDCEWYNSSLLDESGKLRSILSLVLDVTERKRTEDALRFMAQCGTAPDEEFFHALARYLARSLGMDYVCIDRLEPGLLTAQTVAVYFDGKFEDNVSYTLKDTPCGDVVGKRICCFPKNVRGLFLKDVVLQEMLAESYVGTTLWSSRGQPIGLIAIIGRQPLADARVATAIMQLASVRAAAELERRDAEAALTTAKNKAEEAKAQAEHASSAKDHFLAVLSHELRTPLAPVLATVSMLQQRPGFDLDTRELLELIHRNVELEARLIDDLLDVTRITRGKLELDRRPVSLSTVIRRAVEVCAPDIEARKLRFHLDLGPTAPCFVEADPARLQQVFWNLLRNAVKFTPEGGSVVVRCYPDGDDTVVVEVSDTGIGIDPEAIDRIFNAFEQAERNLTRQFGGLGLGLTISRAMVEMHGGQIEARSDGRDLGATFTVKLPTCDPQEAAPAVTNPAGQTDGPAPGDTRRLRILLVEDHDDTAKIMKRLLVGKGHDVETAADVATALQLAGQDGPDPFDLMLSDLGLPDGSGLDLMRTLRKLGRTIPAIAISGYGQEQDIDQSREAGFVAHITKPVNLRQLQETIRMVTSPAAE